MQPNPLTGFFDVQAGETITICVTATNTQFLAAFSAPTCTSWSSAPLPANGKACGTFVAPAGGNCVVVITFDFKPDGGGVLPPDAKYDVDVSGSAGGSFHESVTPPPIQNRQYTFQVI